jgi:hypothetical protein
VSGYGLDDRVIEVRSPTEAKGSFPLASVSRPALRPTQPPVQWVPDVKCGRGVTLTTHPHLAPRSIMSRSYIPSPPSASMACSGTALLYFYFTFNSHSGETCGQTARNYIHIMPSFYTLHVQKSLQRVLIFSIT